MSGNRNGASGDGLVDGRLELRVVATPTVAEQTCRQLAEVMDVHRQRGPRPSRTSPDLVLYYLSGHLPPARSNAGSNGGNGGVLPPAGRPASSARVAVETVETVERLELDAAALRAALAVLTCCDHGGDLDCPDGEPVPGIVRHALAGTAGRALVDELAAAREVVAACRAAGHGPAAPHWAPDCAQCRALVAYQQVMKAKAGAAG